MGRCLWNANNTNFKSEMVNQNLEIEDNLQIEKKKFKSPFNWSDSAINGKSYQNKIQYHNKLECLIKKTNILIRIFYYKIYNSVVYSRAGLFIRLASIRYYIYKPKIESLERKKLLGESVPVL